MKLASIALWFVQSPVGRAVTYVLTLIGVLIFIFEKAKRHERDRRLVEQLKKERVARDAHRREMEATRDLPVRSVVDRLRRRDRLWRGM